MIKKVILYFTNLWYSIIRVGDLKKWLRGNRSMSEFLNLFNQSDKLRINDIAKYFLSKQEMTSKKLQKLVYYAYAWYIALYNENVNELKNKLCVDAKFEAWIHGPVCRNLYAIYADFFGMVPKYNGEISKLITGEIKDFLDNIYDIFGKYTGDELEYMTHQEEPWKNARDNTPPSEPSKKVISEKDMFTYYNTL